MKILKVFEDCENNNAKEYTCFVDRKTNINPCPADADFVKPKNTLTFEPVVQIPTVTVTTHFDHLEE